MSTPQLRQYQQDAVDAAMNTENGLLVEPTGSGKSLIIGSIASRVQRAVILQPSVEILESNLAKAHAFGIEGVSVYSASAGSKELGRITYGTIGTLIKVADELEGIDLLVVDEAHLVNPQAGQYVEFIGKVKPQRLIGATASPYRLHTISDLGSFRTKSGYYTGKISDIRLLTRTRPKSFKKIVHVTQSRDLIAQGFLHQPEFVVSGKDGDGILRPNSSGAEWDPAAVRRYMKKSNINQRVIDAARLALDAGLTRILVFASDLDMSAGFVRDLRRLGVEVDSVDGKLNKRDREYRLAGFRSGRIRIMCNCEVLTVGYDLPQIDCIIGARPTLSLSLYYQMIGRAVRPHPDKKLVRVYDLVNNYGKFGDPLQMQLVAGSTGLYHIINQGGRLTGRDLAAGPECEDKLDWGKHQGTMLKDIPMDYLRWVVDNNKPSEERHQIEAELQRRILFGLEPMGE